MSQDDNLTITAEDLFDVFDELATDEALEVEGAWFPLGPKARLRVASAGNEKYAARLTELVNENRAVLDLGGKAADAKASEILLDVLAQTILVGWEGLAYQGRQIDYSPEAAKMVLKHRKFRQIVENFSADVVSFKAKAEAAQGEA